MSRPPGSTPDPSLAGVVASLVSFLVLLVTVVVTGGCLGADTAIWGWAPSVRTAAVTVAAEVVTTLGSGPVVAAVTVLAAPLLWRRTRNLVSSIVLLASIVSTAAAVYVVKVAVGRPRPPVDALLGTPSLSYAFPSGHTTNGAVTYVLAAILLAATVRTAARRQLLVAAAVLVAVAVGLSRTYLGYHWASDVLAGWCLAAAVVLTATLLANRLAQSDRRPLVRTRAAACP